MSERSRRVLLHSVAPWSPSAYGGQSRLMARSMRARGVEVMLSAGSELTSAVVEWSGHTVYPSPAVNGGSLVHWASELLDPDFGDILLTLIDGHRLYGEPLGSLAVPVVSWLPVHGLDLEPGLAQHIEHTRTRPIALSRSGATAFARSDLADVDVIPHGVDLDTFQMLAAGDRRRSRSLARQALGMAQDEFVIGVVAANSADGNRKCFPEIFAAVSEVARTIPRVRVSLHSDYRGRWTGGSDLHRLANAAGLDGVVPVQCTSELHYRRGVSDEAMAVLYNSLDVLCAPSAAEGFCLPLLEAQACGVPVVASDFTSQADIVAHGILVGGQRRWMPDYETYWFTPDIDEIAEALIEARGLDDRSGEGTAFAQQYDHQRLFEDRWLPILA